MKHELALVPGVPWHVKMSNAHEMSDAHGYE